MCELNVSKYVRKRMKKKKKKKSASNNTRVWLVVMMMMVCEHKAHSWSVSCPSFFSLLRCPLRPYTYTHTPSHHQLRTLIRIFFLFAYARAQAAGHEAKARLFFSFLSLSFFFPLSLCYATLWSNKTSSKSATTVFQSKEKNGRQRWHVYIIIFRSLNTMTK
jgi:hypothetical protein